MDTVAHLKSEALHSSDLPNLGEFQILASKISPFQFPTTLSIFQHRYNPTLLSNLEQINLPASTSRVPICSCLSSLD